MDNGQAWVALGTVDLSALWTSGGQAALQRRVIQQEFELAASLEDEALRAEMRRHAEERATVYLARRRPADSAGRWLFLRTLVLVAGGALASISSRLNTADAGQVQETISAALGLLGLALVGGALGAMGDEVFRDTRAWVGKTRLKYARRRLETDGKSFGSTSSSDA